LACLHKGDLSYDVHAGEFFFDRNPDMFSYILDAYRNKGELHFSHNFCGPLIRRELNFWRLSEERISPCCWKSYKEYEHEENTLNLLDKTFNSQKNELFGPEEQGRVRHGWRKWRKDIWMFLEDPSSSRYSKVCFCVWTTLFLKVLLYYSW
jgi:hypothetical protein